MTAASAVASSRYSADIFVVGGLAFLLAGIVAEGEEAPVARADTDNHIEIDLASGHRMRISGRHDRGALAWPIGMTTALLESLADAIDRHVLSADTIFVDNTSISMLAPAISQTRIARL